MTSREEQQGSSVLLKHPLAHAALLSGYSKGYTNYQIIRDPALFARLLLEMEETQRAINYDRAVLELSALMTIERSA